MSWTEQEYQLIKFQELHQYDASFDTGMGLHRCRCGVQMYWSEYHVHFARALIAAGLAAPVTTSITCPQCGRTSHNPNDIRERYCGNCHQFHDTMGVQKLNTSTTREE